MKQTVAGHKLAYLLQAPAGEKPENGWPLLLFLHGYGECGENIEKVRKHGPPKLIGRFDQLAGCVLISPQCPRDSWWRVDALKTLVEEVIEARGDIDRAIDLYKNSIAFCPTADAHTYLGWMYSAQDRFEEAIEECHLAIEVDPDFGNPYNDIGCYLMELKEIDEAAEWFEKAKTAPRYEPRHFPYMNIARIHLTHARYGQACGELYQALKRAPGEASLRTQLLELLSLLN